jgi:AcrR family transcriptional regulator
MAEPVKTRPYNSPRRRAQAEATRREILTAAQRLFEERGYAGTTIAAIAEEANVALKTVYVTFETKSGILRALWNLLLRGERDDLPIGRQERYRKVLEEQVPQRQLRLNAQNSREAKARIGAIFEVIQSGALVDADIAALWERIQTEYHGNQRVIVESLAKKKALRRGLSVARATDILWTLNHPSTWQLLVGERGWTPEQYERWSGEVACAELLDPRGAARPGRRASHGSRPSTA